jgi:TRAP-type mannitol/chloroaromatic compound transport system substrate-binding protein
MTIKRRNLLKVAGAGVLGAVASPAIAQSSPALKWRCPTSYPKSLATLYGACAYFSKAVQEATDGRFEIQVFSPGEIVPALQVMDAVSNNTVEMGHSAGSFNIGKDPAFGIATGLPWGLNSRQQAAWMYHAGGMDLLNGFFAGFNLYALPAGNTGAQPAGWFRKPIKSLGDIKGLKMRVAGLGGAVLSKLGVVVQQLGAGDIYPALERGTLDAAEFVGPYDDEKLGLVKVAPYYHYPSPWEGSGEINFFFNKAKWDELPKSYKSLLTTAAAAAAHDMQAKYDAFNPPALLRLVGAGAILTQLPQDVIKASHAASLELLNEMSDKSVNFKKIYEHQVAFQKDSQRWLGVSDLSYDYHVTTAMSQR